MSYQNIYTKTRYDEGKRIIEAWIWDDEQGLIHEEIVYHAYIKSPSGDLRSIYEDKLKKTYKWSKKDEEAGNLFESDVSPEVRVLVDRYLHSDEVSTGHRILYIDIEVKTEPEYPDVQIAQNAITSLQLFDQARDKWYVLILDEQDVLEREFIVDGVQVYAYKDEMDMLRKFMDVWEEINPTIITHWNGDKFDVPYIFNRLDRLWPDKSMSVRLSPIGIAFYNERRDRYVIAGVSSLDYMEMYKKFTFNEEASYSLDNISKKVLGRGKVEYDGSLDDLMRTDIARFIRYGITDVELIVDMNVKMKLIELVQGIAHKGHVPYEDIYFSSRYLDGAILTFLKRNDIVAPNKQKSTDSMTEVKFEGAYVKMPIPGKYEWVYDLDFTSLYPSIIISLNISPETKMARVAGWTPHTLVDTDTTKTLIVHMGNEKKALSLGEIGNFLRDNKLTISSNGIIYRTDRKGVVPSILSVWFDDKDRYDRLMDEHGELAAEAEKRGDKAEAARHTALNLRYEFLRTVTKILLNSLYGVLGLPIFRFYDLDNALAVTASGQTLIKYAETMGNFYYNNEMGDDTVDHCIYVDTDSVHKDSRITTDKYGDLPVETLMEKEANDASFESWEVRDGRVFVFPKDLSSLYYDDASGEAKMGKVEYIEGHRVKKTQYKIRTKNGRSITVTEDHSIMVMGADGRTIEKKPADLVHGDQVVSLV